MSAALDKKGWYDGWIYARLIDTQPIPFRYKILKYIDKSCTVLDVGCGTGGFTIEIAKICKKVVGIDISKKQILQAKNRLIDIHLTNIEFKHVNALNISKELNSKFDFAILTLILHEIENEDRILLLNEIAKVAKNIIIMDYNIPHPLNL